MGSDSIPGLAVVLTAFSGSNLRNGEDGARLGAPCCRQRGGCTHCIGNRKRMQTRQPIQRGAGQCSLQTSATNYRVRSSPFGNVTLELNRIVTMLTLCRATVQSQAVPCEIVHGGVRLTAAHQGQRSTGVHHAGGVSQHGGVLRGIWIESHIFNRSTMMGRGNWINHAFQGNSKVRISKQAIFI